MSEEIKKAEVKEEVIATEVATPVEEVTPEVAAPAGNPVIDKFVEYGVSVEDAKKIADSLGIDVIEDFINLETEDLISAGMKTAKARKMLADLKVKDKAAAEAPAPAASAVATTMMGAQFESLLPAVPTDESWLSSLKTGGVLKVDDSTYIAAIRAAMADRVGLYSIPKKLVDLMEDHAKEMEEPVDANVYYPLRKSLTRRSYADIFSAIEGCDGTVVTDTKRNDLLKRIRNYLWPAVAESYEALEAWYKSYKDGFADPSMIVAALSGGLYGGAALPATPDTGIVHDARDALVKAINRVFAGEGVQIATAMAYEANEIRRSLDNSELPRQVGADNREMMLKKIDTGVTSDYIRLEQNVVKYVLGYIKLDNITSDVEVRYLVALYQLGTQIGWSKLGVNCSSDKVGLTGKRVL